MEEDVPASASDLSEAVLVLLSVLGAARPKGSGTDLSPVAPRPRSAFGDRARKQEGDDPDPAPGRRK